jgi:hypothetical protein
METKWSSLVSYGLTVEALTGFLPLDETLSVSTLRTNTLETNSSALSIIVPGIG